MAGDKFDFRVADSLVQAVTAAADTLDVKNGQMEAKFGALQESFKDQGYDAYALDMGAANRVTQEVITQLKMVGAQIAKYAEQLRLLAKP